MYSSSFFLYLCVDFCQLIHHDGDLTQSRHDTGNNIVNKSIDCLIKLETMHVLKLTSLMSKIVATLASQMLLK